MKKKHFITVLTLFALTTMWQTATAQYRIIYIPGDGERQFGISLSPSFSTQNFGVAASAAGLDGQSIDLKVDGGISNHLGFNAGLFYGYETRHNRTLEFGNYASVYYSINPFSGTVYITRDGIAEPHQVQYTAQRILIHFNPFLSFMINDQFSVSAGIGVSFAPQLKNKVKLDGIALERPKGNDANIESAILGLFNFHFDANAGVKYWFSDEWFCGLRLQYCFYTLGMLSLFDSDNSIDLSKYPNGIADLDLDHGTAVANYFLPKSTAQAVISLGYVW